MTSRGERRQSEANEIQIEEVIGLFWSSHLAPSAGREETCSGSSAAQREAYFCSNYDTIAAWVFYSIFKVEGTLAYHSEAHHWPASPSFDLQSVVIRENPL